MKLKAQWAQYDDKTWMFIRSEGGLLGEIKNVTPDGATEEEWLYRTKDAAGQTYSKRQAMRAVRQCAESEAA